MTKNMFAERERGLENEFFYKVDQELLRKLREKSQFEEDTQALARETGIADTALLRELCSLGITCESLLAISLIPLIQVAWCDRLVDARERAAILDAAQQQGIAEHTPSYDLLKTWLNHQPDAQLFTAWKHYVGDLATTLDHDRLRHLKEDVLGRARSVAEAAGGTLGFGSISNKEESVLQELEESFVARN